MPCASGGKWVVHGCSHVVLHVAPCWTIWKGRDCHVVNEFIAAWMTSGLQHGAILAAMYATYSTNHNLTCEIHIWASILASFALSELRI